MSLREEEQKKASPSRGLGLAAAAIGVGVGVGAALYYLFSKRTETPDSEGSTGQEWVCEHPQALTLEQQRLMAQRAQAFRERTWSLEECAICFEVMLNDKDDPLLSLPCTHNFHAKCIEPWLQERQTCPVCRKAA